MKHDDICKFGNIDPDSIVTKEYCTQRGTLSKWIYTLVFSLMTLFLGLTTFSMSMSNGATGKVEDAVIEVQNVQSDLKTHQARAEERDKAVIDKLNSIQTELVSQRVEQKRLLEKILTNNEN